MTTGGEKIIIDGNQAHGVLDTNLFGVNMIPLQDIISFYYRHPNLSKPEIRERIGNLLYKDRQLSRDPKYSPSELIVRLIEILYNISSNDYQSFQGITDGFSDNGILINWGALDANSILESGKVIIDVLYKQRVIIEMLKHSRSYGISDDDCFLYSDVIMKDEWHNIFAKKDNTGVILSALTMSEINVQPPYTKNYFPGKLFTVLSGGEGSSVNFYFSIPNLPAERTITWTIGVEGKLKFVRSGEIKIYFPSLV